MKHLATAVGIAALQVLVPQTANAQTTKTTEKTEIDRDGTTTKTTTTTTFKPEIRQRVISYFDTYKTRQYGLPPGFFGTVKVEQIPMTWRTSRIEPGVVIADPQREYLVPAPPELIKLLPAPEGTEVRYYVAGSNVVAVNQQHKVVDSIHIPTIKFEAGVD